jgi:glycosyltransferase involved in cell wall biosynthesis
MQWSVLAGEFPPDRGGVGRHTSQLAHELARSGKRVVVFTQRGETRTDGSIEICAEAGRWTRDGLARLGTAFDAEARPRRLLVPYAPNVFGRRGLNLAVCRWLVARAEAGDEIHLIVHEPFYPWRLVDKPSRWVLAAVQRLMMRRLLAASARVYLSTMSWEPLLRPFAPPGLPMVHLPSFSNVPVEPPAAGDGIRARLTSGASSVVGSFGAQPGEIRELLSEIVSRTASSDTCWVFMGDGSRDVASFIASACPASRPYIHATGTVDESTLSAHLHACDVMVQPYRDGITTRRTTAMACLAHGVPVVTNHGMFTEPMWRESQAVLLSDGDSASLAANAATLLADVEARRRLGLRGRAVYERQFAPRHAAHTLAAASSWNTRRVSPVADRSAAPTSAD